MGSLMKSLYRRFYIFSTFMLDLKRKLNIGIYVSLEIFILSEESRPDFMKFIVDTIDGLRNLWVLATFYQKVSQ